MKVGSCCTSLLMVLPSVVAFSPTLHPTKKSWALGPVIKGEDLDVVPLDPGSGGVKLAQENAVKIFGNISHKPGSATAKPEDLLRYTQIVECSKPPKVICVGTGRELYKDPGETTVKEIKLAPHEAVRDSLNSAGSALESPKLVVNFLGGDCLQFSEVMDACRDMVLDLDIATNAKVFFNSLSDSSIPNDLATVAVIPLDKDDDEKDGEFYYYNDDKWFTVREEDLNTAVA